jgi:asparagine synthase (glutamine-hydrolysing)
MPGLAGFVTLRGPAEGDVAQMASRLSLSKRGVEFETFSMERAAVACDVSKRSPRGSRIAVEEGIVLALDGEVFSLAGNDGATSEVFARGTPGEPARSLLRLYRHLGVDFASRLRGHFALVIWDGSADTLFLVSDRFGMRPLYYRNEGNCVAFASEVKALLGPTPEALGVDEKGICDFILFGIPLRNRTFFSGIRCLPPASILTFRKDKPVSERLYWELEFQTGPVGDSGINSAARALRTTLGDVLEETTSPDGVLDLPLSGGLDTRSLAALCASIGRPLRTYSIGSEGSEDLRLGPVVARDLGVPNSAWPVAPKDLMDWTGEAVYITDGMYNPMDSAILFIARRLPEDVQIVLDGASSFDGHYNILDPALAPLLPSLYSGAKMALKTLVAPIVFPDGTLSARVLDREYESFARKHALTVLEELAESVPPADRGNPFDYADFLELRNRLPRYNMMGAVLLRAYHEVQQPFFDPRVVDLITRFKPSFRTKDKLVLGRLVRIVAPELAALTYERTGLPADSHVVRHVFRYAKTSLQRGGGKLVPVLRREPKAAIDYNAWVQRDAGLQESIRALLFQPRIARRGYFCMDSVRSCVEELFRGRTEYLPLVGRMVALELWHRYFVEDERGLDSDVR